MLIYWLLLLELGDGLHTQDNIRKCPMPLHRPCESTSSKQPLHQMCVKGFCSQYER
ncbi:hypothetical protein MTR_8g467550 [Medicago truncatula]|uniref:Nodule Cysteine-Rich (NCR) secreted peptide n=1 Tax=Medicago truncatula TaxID=3880 RepID=A0A072U1R5_MEDTR|nr:hypothetical protein MTR_8g467550 [Medicago truncatula]